MIRKITLSLILLVATTSLSAQEVNLESNGIYIEPKLNVVAACVGIVNPAVEIGFGKSSAFEISTISSFAQDDFLNTGYPLLLNIVMLEYRNYIFSDNHKGFFVAANGAWHEFKMHKGQVPFLHNVSESRDYDWGVGVFLGVTLGYKFKLTKALPLYLELSATGGWQHSWHEPYMDGELYVAMNATGEWTPYKVAANLSYRLGKWYRAK
ncbi:MAG: DUF3575 domain-containing protein [Rikenellaceae bacterium]